MITEGRETELWQGKEAKARVGENGEDKIMQKGNGNKARVEGNVEEMGKCV